MVHAGFEKRFAVQLAPQPDGSQLVVRRHRLVGEVAGDFFGRQVDVGKDHDSGSRLFEHLGAPAGVAAAIETFAALAAQAVRKR